MTTLVLILFWLLAITAFARGVPALIRLFFVSIPFGSLAVIPPTMTGGLTLTPLPIAALLLSFRILANVQNITTLLHESTRARPQALLLAFWITAVIVTMLMPRFFAGEIMIVPVRATESGLAPLYPSTQNISQLAYLTISVLTALSMSIAMEEVHVRQSALRSLLFAGIVLAGTGFVDFSGQYIPIAPLLDAFRTATYALLVDAEVLGAKRIVGLMPEASTFGSTCVVLLSLTFFLRRSFAPIKRLQLLAMPVCSLLAFFAILSSSSAAYSGLAVFIVLAVLEWTWRAIRQSTDPLMRSIVAVEFAFAIASFICLIVALLFTPSIISSVMDVLRHIFIEKLSSSSFDERSLWTSTAWNALWSSYGLGVGVGGSRASNFWAALASNAGFLGALTYAAFIASCYLRRSPVGDAQAGAILAGCRWALVPSLAIGALIGTSADFGVVTAFTLATMLATGRRQVRRSAVGKNTEGSAPRPAPAEASGIRTSSAGIFA